MPLGADAGRRAEIKTQPLTAEAFALFGDVLAASGDPDKFINEGRCGQFHDRAQKTFGPGGYAGINIPKAELRHLPHTLDMVKRHPDGS